MRDTHIHLIFTVDMEKAYAMPKRIDQTEVTLILSKATLEPYLTM